MTVSFQIFNSYAAKTGYTRHRNSMPAQDTKLALDGWKFTQPDFLPDGLNGITGGNNDGAMNRYSNGYKCKYDDNGEPPKTTMQFIA